MTASARERYDVVVLGAGAGGMTAALVAAIEGRRTLLIERSDQVGGTMARSSGSAWIPDNPDQRERLGVTDDAAAALEYLEHLTGGHADRELLEAFLAAGPAMLRYLATHADLRFRAYAVQPDYYQELPGAVVGGRALEPPPFDGRRLGASFARVRWPLPELMLFGGMMVTRGEVVRLLRIGRSWDALWLGARLTARYLRDRVRHPRGTRLVLGNGLAARLFHDLLARGVDVWFETTATRLVKRGGGVCGLVVERAGAQVELEVADGVVLAGGGFAASEEWRSRHLPEPTPRHSAAFEGCVGETLALALSAGAALGPPGTDNAYWFPSSLSTRPDGSTVVYPHIVLDRAKPGLVAVNATGRRFINEAVSYHEFVRAMYQAHAEARSIPAVLVCDRRFVWRYGLGLIRPRTLRLKPFVDRGYLVMADSLAALAERMGLDATGLQESVRAHNCFAQSGVDGEFGKGESAYDRAYGDPDHAPNPCLGTIDRAPYCAVAVWPTPLGTSLGVRANAHAQALDDRGVPIDGLYVCGHDMHSITRGEYPGSGAQIGMAMTFGYLAATHAAGGGRQAD